MRANFETLVRRIADESDYRDRGLRISSDTAKAYRALLAQYTELTRSCFAALDTQGKTSVLNRRNFIEDAPRTIYMIRALQRAILARTKGGANDVQVVEAGTGAGLLMAAALALNPRTYAIGYDFTSSCITVTQDLIHHLGYQARSHLEERDLIKDPPQISPDVLIAEHIDPGLRCEQAVAIPRVFAIDPNFAIPYAVTPGVYWARNNSTDRGETIALAARGTSDGFYVSNAIELTPSSIHPIAVCCDVEWSSPMLGNHSLLQRSTNTLRDQGWENHLLQAQWLRADRNKNSYLGICNYTKAPQTITYSVAYPIGNFWHKKPTIPRVRIVGSGVVPITLLLEQVHDEIAPDWKRKLAHTVQAFMSYQPLARLHKASSYCAAPECKQDRPKFRLPSHIGPTEL